MYGYNESIDDISTNFYANIYKSHTSLSFHQVREAIESNTVALYNVYGEYNPCDILSKHWSYSKIWKKFQTFLFGIGGYHRLAVFGVKGGLWSSKRVVT